MLSACQSNDSIDNRRIEFGRHVESCICRQLDWQADSYSRLPFEEMAEICNETVHSSNPERFSDQFDARPALSELRCPEDVEAWLEVVEENRVLEESNRKLFNEVRELAEQHAEQKPKNNPAEQSLE